MRGTADRLTLYSLVASGLPVVREPLVSAGGGGNVVAPLSSFVGRETELAEVSRAIDEHRLVTLIGVGGVGKTRLAIEAGLEAWDQRDGVWLVELGLIDSVDEVAAAVSDALPIPEQPSSPQQNSSSDATSATTPGWSTTASPTW